MSTQDHHQLKDRLPMSIQDHQQVKIRLLVSAQNHNRVEYHDSFQFQVIHLKVVQLKN